MNRNEVSLIAGKWRSRKISFAEEAGLRPTHSRIRETLFNWLAPVIENSLCLDAFSGSGALGFEALSRGAKQVTFCELSKKVMRALQKNAFLLKADNAEFIQADFTSNQFGVNKKFDVVFLDPPFQKNLLLQSCELLVSRTLLNTDALIYLECEKDSVDFSLLPACFTIEKHKQTQTIDYVLCRAEISSP